MVTLRVGVGKDIKEDYPRTYVSNVVQLWGWSRRSQLSQSKKSVLMSINNFPNSDRFWQ